MASAQLPPQTERAELFWGSKCPKGSTGHERLLGGLDVVGVVSSGWPGGESGHR